MSPIHHQSSTRSVIQRPYKSPVHIIEAESILFDKKISHRTPVHCRCPECPPAGRVMQYRSWLLHDGLTYYRLIRESENTRSCVQPPLEAAAHNLPSTSLETVGPSHSLTTDIRPSLACSGQGSASLHSDDVNARDDDQEGFGFQDADGLIGGFDPMVDDGDFYYPDNDLLQGPLDDSGSSRFANLLAEWPMAIPPSLSPTASGRHPNPHMADPFSHDTSPRSSKLPLLASCLAISTIILTTFTGLSQQIGDMVLFLSQIEHSLTVDEVRKQLRSKWAADPDVSEVERQRAYSLLDSPVELSSSSLHKNVKSLYQQFEIEPEIVVHPKCPTLECQNVLYDVVNHKGFDKVYIGIRARILEGLEQLVEQQKTLHTRQRMRDSQMEHPTYLGDVQPGKILHHQLDRALYQTDNGEREDDSLLLTLNFSIDWADPSKS
ncbi:hypothetical protein C362_03527 [Cryptococcus neoformans Bt1]|nr:hypothetical protein C362_03527 [Cryptococcus neoformans var. grubii Bt1]